MVNQERLSGSQRLAWLEGIRMLAAVWLLLYHAQLLFTDYAYTPQPTGLWDNWQKLIAPVNAAYEPGSLGWLLGVPIWFGYQFVDVFVLISGFSLVLSLKGKPLQVRPFLLRRLGRILWPFWTVAWLGYPVLWAIGTATNSYVPNPWQVFAGTTFPILFDYDGNLLLRTSGPWWFVPLIISFAVIFPFLWKLLHRWGATNLIVVSTGITLIYRLLAVYVFDGHPTYTILETASDWQPFLTFIAKLSTFVIGMVMGVAATEGKGPIFWSTSKAFLVGIPIYLLGFVCQFDRAGWVVVDLLLPLGLTLCLMGLFRAIAEVDLLSDAMGWLGRHSYSYFLIHNFVVDRTIKLVIQDNASLYVWCLPVMMVGTLALAVIVDATTPLLQRLAARVVKDLDYVLQVNGTPNPRSQWVPQVGETVGYRGRGGWNVLKVETLLDEQEFFLCQVSDGQRSVWVNANELEPSGKRSPRSEVTDR